MLRATVLISTAIHNITGDLIYPRGFCHLKLLTLPFFSKSVLSISTMPVDKKIDVSKELTGHAGKKAIMRHHIITD